MGLFGLVFVLLAIAMVGMAIGVILTGQRGELKGSCGGPDANPDCCQTCPEKDACDGTFEDVHASLGLPPSKGDHASLGQVSTTSASGSPVATPTQ